MIRATFSGTTLSLQGHAGAAAFGQDLICAAVTGLVYALAQRLTELEKAEAFQEPPTIRLEAGAAMIRVLPKAAYALPVQEDFRLLHSGLTLLQTHYPNHIQLNELPGKEGT